MFQYILAFYTQLLALNGQQREMQSVIPSISYRASTFSITGVNLRTSTPNSFMAKESFLNSSGKLFASCTNWVAVCAAWSTSETKPAAAALIESGSVIKYWPRLTLSLHSSNPPDFGWFYNRMYRICSCGCQPTNWHDNNKECDYIDKGQFTTGSL